MDGHPVVYPGAGSHATYLERGEYIMLLPFPGERNIRGPLDLLRRVWRDTLAQPDPGDLAARAKRALSVPFVDYARGDGKVVGPGGDVEWTPIIVSDEDGWIDRYRGLWGLDTGDRFAGERAPGRAEVHADGLGPPVVARPARVRRPRQGRAAIAGDPDPRGADRGADDRAGRGRRRGRTRWPSRSRSSTRRSPPCAARPAWTAIGRHGRSSSGPARSG